MFHPRFVRFRFIHGHFVCGFEKTYVERHRYRRRRKPVDLHVAPKTGIPFHVKLLDIPIKILEKYRGLAKENLIFPVLGHGRINYALKIIARHCKIDKAISFHQSRHTFVSQLCLSQGVPIESVSRMMGHRNIQTTQRYARVNNEKIGNDMKALSKRLANKFSYVKQLK